LFLLLFRFWIIRRGNIFLWLLKFRVLLSDWFRIVIVFFFLIDLKSLFFRRIGIFFLLLLNNILLYDQRLLLWFHLLFLQIFKSFFALFFLSVSFQLLIFLRSHCVNLWLSKLSNQSCGLLGSFWCFFFIWIISRKVLLNTSDPCLVKLGRTWILRVSYLCKFISCGKYADWFPVFSLNFRGFRTWWVSVNAQDRFEIWKSFFFHLAENKISSIDVGKVPHRSTEPFELFTFILLQHIILSSNNNYRNLHSIYSSCVFMPLPFFVHCFLNLRSLFRIWSLKLWIKCGLSFSHNIHPVLKIMQCGSRFW